MERVPEGSILRYVKRYSRYAGARSEGGVYAIKHVTHRTETVGLQGKVGFEKDKVENYRNMLRLSTTVA